MGGQQSTQRPTWNELQTLRDEHVPMWAFDYVHERMLWANEAALHFWQAESYEEFIGRDFSKDSRSVRERLWQTIDALKPGQWARDSWSLFPNGKPRLVLLDACFVEHPDTNAAILFRYVRDLEFAQADPGGLRMMQSARVTPTAVTMFSLAGELLSENPAGLALRRAHPGWTKRAQRLQTRYGADTSWAEKILEAVREDERLTFECSVPDPVTKRVLAVTVRRIRDPVNGDVVAQVTEEDITKQADLADSLARLNDELERRVEQRSKELLRLNERLQLEVDQRVKAQREAERERDFLSSLLEAIPVPIFYKREDGTYLGCNERWSGLVGRHRDEIVGGKSGDLNSKLERAVAHNDESVLRSGVRIEAPFHVRYDDGNVRDLIGFSAPFEKLDGVRGVIGAVVDVTDQRRNEHQLRSRESLLREATFATGTGFVVYDNDTRRVEYSTDSVPDLLGLSEEDYRRLIECIDNRFSLMHNAHGDEVQRVVAAAEQAGDSFEIHFEVKHGSQAGRVIRVKGYPLAGPRGASQKRVAFLQDMTDSLQMEEALQRSRKLEAVGQLTGGIAHDFNNLLAVVRASAEMMSISRRFEAELVDDIENACKRGTGLTHNLLAYARQQRLNAESIDLAERCRSIEQILRRTLGEDIDLTLEVQTDLWPAFADPGQVEDAILNLAINARDAMPAGGKLGIELSNVALDDYAQDHRNDSQAVGDFVAIGVTDNGSGMSKEVLAKATDPFFTTKPAGQGSGLGLSRIYGFARQSGGNLIIQSDAGVGTTVRLFLPRDLDERDELTSVSTEARVPSGRGEDVILVEDDPAVRKLTARLLRTLNYKVTAFEYAQAALDHLHSGGKARVLLSDVILPGGTSGFELVRSVRAQFPGVRCLLMSGYPATDSKRQTGTDADTVLLDKPISRERFAVAIQAALA